LTASSKVMPCLRWLVRALMGSHSNRIISQPAYYNANFVATSIITPARRTPAAQLEARAGLIPRSEIKGVGLRCCQATVILGRLVRQPKLAGNS
jgi:hypothetical protein